MGTQNRMRRAARARAKARSRARARRTPWADGSAPDQEGGRRPDGHDSHTGAGGRRVLDDEAIRWLLCSAASGGDPRFGRWPGDPFQRLTDAPHEAAERQVEDLLTTRIAALWDSGWQPAEVLREGRRSGGSAPAARLVALVIAVDDAARRAGTLDPRWRDQVASLDLPPSDGRPGWYGQWVFQERLGWRTTLERTVAALKSLVSLPAIEALLPLPGRDGGPPRPVDTTAATLGAAPTRGAVPDPMLDKVRNLLAKAESTTFEAEAIAFTAKAHELITRHAIDTALLGRQPGDTDGPAMIRIPIDAPYVDAKSLLLQIVAEATRCRAVFHKGLDLSSVVGFPDDIAATEMLFTSLLVQAQRALHEAARVAPPGTRVRTKRYRSSFFVSFAHRIGDRLRATNQSVVADADAAATATGGRSAVPVLQAREEAVDAVLAAHFGALGHGRVRGGYDAAGWSHGQLAAERADLARADLTR